MDSWIDSFNSSYYKLSLRDRQVIFFLFPFFKMCNYNYISWKESISINKKSAKPTSLGH
jgi:hypothetical protein